MDLPQMHFSGSNVYYYRPETFDDQTLLVKVYLTQEEIKKLYPQGLPNRRKTQSSTIPKNKVTLRGRNKVSSGYKKGRQK